MVMIGGKIVSYEFDPQYDMDIRFSAAFKAQAGRSYDECGNRAQLVFQLLCHAVRQLQSANEANWRLEKTEEILSLDYEYVYDNEGNIKAAIPVPVICQMTYTKYQIKVDGELVLTLRNSSDCDYLIDYYAFSDPSKDDDWLESLCDCAKKHCNMYGRM